MVTAAAAPTKRSRLAVFWASSVGKKIVMGATGLVMVGFLVVHVAGNLQLFLGREVFNKYSALLHTSEELLWVARSILIGAVMLHVIAAFQLTMRDRAARPVPYAKRVPQAATLASRLMRIGGLIILVFIPVHLLNFTTGSLNPAFVRGDVYGNVVYAFQEWPLLSLFYVVAMVFVGFHLYHGAWAMVRTLGIAKPSPRPMERAMVAALAWGVTIGFVALPAAVLLGIVR
jgi:succinate dehydrogenase / fumarate reductase cytochrome b subunit